MRPAPTKLLTLDGDAWGFHSPRQTFLKIIEPRPRLVRLPQRQIILERPQDYANFLGASSDEMERFVRALELGDEEAMRFFDRTVAMQYIDSGRFAVAFSPYDDVFNSGSGTATTPAGAGQCTVTSDGGGGGGSQYMAGGGSRGGGGSARCVSTKTVSAGDSLGYVVGAGGAGRTSPPGDGVDGGASTTSSGTGGFSGLAHSAGGGGRGTTSDGTAGTASGGTTNTNGNAANIAGDGGTAASGAAGGLAAEALYEPPWTGVPGYNGTAPGGGGGAGFYSTNNGGYQENAGSGGAGRQRFAWAV